MDLQIVNIKMLNTKPNQQGFIPMIIVFLLLIGVVIYLAFTQVLHNQK